MNEALEDRNLVGMDTLVSPRHVKEKLPATESMAELVRTTRAAIRDVVYGRDATRLVVVVGPCSIHDPAAAYEYAGRLAPIARAFEDELIVVMRTYFEKPRTTVGWKGLVNDPHLDDTCDVAAGLELARTVLCEVNGAGLPCGTEFLDPIAPQYSADLISWAAVGARTTESQTHREMASGLSMPVGFKNGTDGMLAGARNAMVSARQPHSFVGINSDGVTSVVKTAGNPDCHLVLRGGREGTNYAPEDIAAAAAAAPDGLLRPVMVDTSHDNSGKDHTRQAEVCRDVISQFAAGQRAIMGLMIESNLEAGKQPWAPGAELRYGVSVTDACIGWEETERLLAEIAKAVASPC